MRRGATLGANCTIVCGVEIGEYAFVGAGSVVNRDAPAFALVVGVPARQIGWMSKSGKRLALPLDGNASADCPFTGELLGSGGAPRREHCARDHFGENCYERAYRTHSSARRGAGGTIAA